MPCTEIMLVVCKNHTEHTNTLDAQSAQLLVLKLALRKVTTRL